MQKKADRRKYIIIILSLLLFGSILYIASFRSNQTLLTPDQGAITFNGLHKTQSKAIEHQGIAIPGLECMVFIANQTQQRVNFYNPKENEGILIKLSLVVDGHILWESGYLEAGKAYYSIDLNNPLEEGTYTALLNYDCFMPDGTTLNSAQMELTLYVE